MHLRILYNEQTVFLIIYYTVESTAHRLQNHQLQSIKPASPIAQPQNPTRKQQLMEILQ